MEERYKAEAGLRMGRTGKGATREKKRKKTKSVRGDFTSLGFS
jgi:hypothetical protein